MNARQLERRKLLRDLQPDDYHVNTKSRADFDAQISSLGLRELRAHHRKTIMPKLSTAEAAAKLNPPVSERRLRQYVAQGRIKAVKVGNTYVFDERDVKRGVQPLKRGRPKK